MEEIEQLEEQLNTLKEQLEEKKRAEAIASLYIPRTVTQKAEAFDRLQKQCIEYAKRRITKDTWDNEDDIEYIYETTMEETLRKNAFDILRKF